MQVAYYVTERAEQCHEFRIYISKKSTGLAVLMHYGVKVFADISV